METAHRPSALDSILKIFGLSNTPTLATSEEEIAADVDEPPDHLIELVKETKYAKSLRPANNTRRESLLTQAIVGGPRTSGQSRQLPTRAMSTGSSQSIQSMADLTSDGDLTSPVRSVSPSPPSPAVRFPNQLFPIGKHTRSDKVIIAPVTKDDKPVVADVGEAAVEKSLGRKRCIMFACADTSVEPVKELTPAVTPVEESKPEPAPRKSRLTFACPTRTESTVSTASTKSDQSTRPSTVPSPVSNRTTSVELVKPSTAIPTVPTIPEEPISTSVHHQISFHEFGNSQDETDAWVDRPAPPKPKLTLDDCMKKENAIRRIAKEAEDEADAEILEEQEMDEDEAEVDHDAVDDFAPSDDDDASDGGNESDDENGFADSDDESEDGSEYQFWAPSTATAATSVDNITHFSLRQRSRGSSVSSDQSHTQAHPKKFGGSKQSKAIRMRPGTPELPDSTDFVCGTLDEDRPLEAAYISCREQRKREKHVPIPQDIDPSFPTTDPEDNEDDDEDDFSEPAWLREQFGIMEDEHRGRRTSTTKVAADHAPAVIRPEPVRPHVVHRKTTNRSPPPPRHRSPPPPRYRSPAPPKHRSPPSRKLFGHSPSRMQSPPPSRKLNSPRGSPAHTGVPLGITITRLAQRPNNNRTASLPFTPNPFFRNWQLGSPATSRIRSGAVTPGLDHEESRPDLHVRGPVDIVIGLEKKRQKRKEKFWRQHCRKAAKEQAERKCAPGRGVERMKELGLECAERTRGYGLGQQAQLVLSL